MRCAVSVAVLSFLLVSASPRSAFAAIDDKAPDAQSIAALELKANQAGPREQCFLYAELVHQMIEFSSAQYAAGEIDKAADTLKHVNVFAQKIHMAVANDEKRLKNAQILLRHTAFRLTELLHASSIEDKPLVEQTLVQVNQIQTETMLQVFRK
jgi:flavin-binding protein dodecin